jgi:MFS family permease
VGRILDGLTAGNLSVAQAYIADNTAPRDRARSFALIGIAFGLGFTLGPALTAYLSRFGMSVPLYAAAALSLTSIGCTITLLPAERKVEAGGAEGALKPAGERLGVLSFGRYAQYFRRPVLSGLLAEFFFYLLAFSMFMSGFALFAERRYFWHGKPFTPHEIGWLFTVGGVVGVIIQGGLLGRLVSRLGERRLIGFGLLCLGTGYALLDYVDPIVPLVAVTVLSALGNALLRPCLTSLITQVASREEQGVVLGLTQSLASTAAIAAAPLSGWFIDHLHLAAWGWVAAGFCAIALFAGRSGSSRVRFDPSQTDYGGPTPAA